MQAVIDCNGSMWCCTARMTSRHECKCPIISTLSCVWSDTCTRACLLAVPNLATTLDISVLIHHMQIHSAEP